MLRWTLVTKFVHLALVLTFFGWFAFGQGEDGGEDEELCHADCFCLDSFFQCGGRGLKSLPSRLPTWITKLDLSQNEIRELDPDALSSLKYLQSLSLDGNNFTRIPTTRRASSAESSSSQVSQLQYLTQLTLARNGIESIEGSRLGSFVSLRHLDLSSNQIQKLTNLSFSSPSPLRYLNLDSNLIETLESHALDLLTALTDLHLAKNQINFLARDAFAQLKNLERLDLSLNNLQIIDSLRFQNLKKLQVLNIRRNPLSNLSDAAFYGLENIQHLYMEWGSIRVVEKRWLYGLRSLRTLNLSHNLILKVEEESCEYLEELQTLDLSTNKIVGVSRKTFLGLSSLLSLDLRNNSIVDLEPDAFNTLDKMNTLDMSENKVSWAVEDVASPFRGLKELTVLNLASNQIHFLHGDALKGLHSLKVLNLSSNPLAWLSEKSVLPIPNAAIILLDVKTFLCDCETRWLQTRLSGSTSQPRQSTFGRGSKKGDRGGGSTNVARKNIGPLCSHPITLSNKYLLDVAPEQLSCPDNSPKPMFLTQPLTQVFLVEGSGSLHCSVQASSVRIHWRKDHKELPKHFDANVRTRVENGNEEDVYVFHSTLDFVNASWNDVGLYQCVCVSGEFWVYSMQANITVHVFPSFVKKPSNVTVRLGSNAKLECGAKGFPMPEIAFQKDGGEDFPAALERRFHVMPNDDSYFIMEVKLADMGTYSCSARNAAGEIRANATVTVYETPSFSEPMEDENAVEGSNAILECMAGGSPKPQISWAKEGVTILEGRSKRVHFTENGSLLLIKDVQPSDAGRYECLLKNAVGTARGVLTLSVHNSASVKSLNLDNAAMTIIFIIIAVFCVVVTSAAWVVVIYRTRKRIKTHSCLSEKAPLRHSKFEDFEMELPNFPPLPYNQVTTKVICGDGESESESSSGKDSGTGTGDDIPDSRSAHGCTEDLNSSANLLRGVASSTDSFSTFGRRASGVTPQSQQPPFRQHQRQTPRVDLNLKSDISRGKDYGGKAKCIPLPVPPTHPHLQVQLTAASIHDRQSLPVSEHGSSREELESESSLALDPTVVSLTRHDAKATSTPV